MRVGSLSIVASLSTLPLAYAGGGETWHDAPEPVKATVTVTETKVIPTTEYEIKVVPTTIYDTISITETELVTKFETTTVISAETITATTTVTETEAENVVVTETESVTSFETTTVISAETITATFFLTETEAQNVPVTEIVTQGVTNFQTITDIQTVVRPCEPTPDPTTPLDSLVLCTTRDVNPTFTLPAKETLPSNYTWGCPPGTLCTPKQVDCNFEVGLPGPDYLCPSERCLVPPELPEYTNFDGPWDEDYDCGVLIKPVEGYFQFDPRLFGLGYWVFDFAGQTAPVCPVEPPPAAAPPTWVDVPSPPAQTSWVDVPAPAPPVSWVDVPPPAVSSQWVDVPPPAVSSHWVDVPPPAVSSHWADVAPPAAPNQWQDDDKPVHISPNGGWGDSKTPYIKRALELSRRQADGEERVPRNCYEPCDNCAKRGMKVGKNTEELCPGTSSFQNLLRACRNCIGNIKTQDPKNVPPLLPDLTKWISVCEGGNDQEEPAQPPAPVSEPPSEPTSEPSPEPPVEEPPTTTPTAPEVEPATTAEPEPTSTVQASPPPPATDTVTVEVEPTRTGQTLVTTPADTPTVSTAGVAPSTFTGIASSTNVPQTGWLISLISVMFAMIGL